MSSRPFRFVQGMWACGALVCGGCVGDASGSSPPEAIAKKADETIPLGAAKLLIEHNASDDDTGFQGFVDGEPWKRLDVRGPDGTVLTVRPHGNLNGFGLTELFFETNEPPGDEVPLEDVLDVLPAGAYEFNSKTVDGIRQNGVATLSHRIPAGPEIIEPEEDAEVAHDEDLVVRWNPVTSAIFGGTNAAVTHYQLIVEKAEQAEHAGFGRETYSVHMPASVLSMRVPHEFLQAATAYSFEMLAIEANGNQTITESAFTTE